jgi:hypothetical protein
VASVATRSAALRKAVTDGIRSTGSSARVLRSAHVLGVWRRMASRLASLTGHVVHEFTDEFDMSAAAIASMRELA